jgi:hypothetical protein
MLPLGEWADKSQLAKTVPGLTLALYLFKESLSGASKWKHYIDILSMLLPLYSSLNINNINKLSTYSS